MEVGPTVPIGSLLMRRGRGLGPDLPWCCRTWPDTPGSGERGRLLDSREHVASVHRTPGCLLGLRNRGADGKISYARVRKVMRYLRDHRKIVA